MYAGRLLFAAIMFAGVSSLSHASVFEIADQSVQPDPSSQTTAFHIIFTEPPDFFGFDSTGRPKQAFQYFYDADANADGIFFGESVTVLRGPEIPFDNVIPIRETLNETGEEFPHAEGWGKSRGDVPFTLDDRTLTFTVPWNLLGETDNQFSYHLILLQQGELTDEVMVTAIPLPQGARSGIAALTLALLVAWKWRGRIA